MSPLVIPVSGIGGLAKRQGHGEMLYAVGPTLVLLLACVAGLLALTWLLVRANGWTAVAKGCAGFAIFFAVIGGWYGFDALG